MIINVVESISSATWLPPHPFLNLGVKSRLIYEYLRSKSEI